jgi:uncharacterized membrane protein YvlD (DUF360 family)
VFEKTVLAVRLLLGIQYVLSGMNYWIKMLPFPNVYDPPPDVWKHEIMRTMMESGWMMDGTKAIEFITGLALLLNIFAPLMLIVSFPIALVTFMVDALILDDIFGWMTGSVSGGLAVAKIMDMIFFGGCMLAMQAYLMLAYLPRHYRPIFAVKAQAALP